MSSCVPVRPGVARLVARAMIAAPLLAASLLGAACEGRPSGGGGVGRGPGVAGDSGAPQVSAPEVAATTHADSSARVLRVCADPNNLPFSNRAGEGFENRLAELVAQEMGATVSYTWWVQRRGFVRNTLRAHECDVMIGVPSSYELVLATRPYYRSTYVFVHREDAPFTVRTLDDSVLRRLRIGVHVIGDDYSNTPAAHALGERGIVRNVRGYSIYGNYSRPNPPAAILTALVEREIDVAVVWGPLAGYFVPRQPVAMRTVPVEPQIDLPFLPFVYDISMGVRRDDPTLRLELDRILVRRRAEIERILDEYGVPRVALRGARTGG